MTASAANMQVEAAAYEAAADHATFYFDLTAVLTRCPSAMRNPDRLKLMCEHVVERIAPAEVILFKDGGFFLMVQSCDGPAADILAGAVNFALIKLFFGTECISDNNLPSIFRSVPVAEIIATGMALPRTPKLPDAIRKAEQASFERMQKDPLLHLAESGMPQYYGLSRGFLPVYNLQRGTASVFFCTPIRTIGGKVLSGTAALTNIDPRDRPSLDNLMLQHSLYFARQIVPTKHATMVGATVSYETLATSRGRQLYQHALRTANVANNPFFIVKIDDIPAGTPVNRLSEIVAMVRPFVKRVFVQLPDCEFDLIRAGNIGVSGLGVSLSPNATLATVARTATWLQRTAAAQNAVSCLDSINRQAELDLARRAGIRFAAGAICNANGALDEPPVDGARHPPSLRLCA